MRKIGLLILAIIILSISTIILDLYTTKEIKRNNELYQYFKEQELVDINKEINLSAVIKEKENLRNKMVALFKNNNYDYEQYTNIIKDMANNNSALQKDIDKLSEEKDILEKKNNTLKSQYNVLLSKYNSLKKNTNSASSSNTNNSYNFPLINQYPVYYSGCESVALTMLLRYHGISVTPDQVISKLKKTGIPTYQNGKLYGGNPELEYVGNPYSSSAYGVYEKPIAAVANSFKKGVQAKSNFPFNEVIQLVESGTPVMVWTSMYLAVPYISRNWIYKPTMETIKWKANEHAVVIIDVTNTTVVVADPIGGKIKSYSRNIFENRYNYYGKKAVYYL